MKKLAGILLFLGLFPAMTVLLCSCGREVPGVGEGALPVGESPVRIVVTDPFTKAGGIVYERDEKPVARWAYFIFEHASGRLVARGEVDGSQVAARRMRTGEYDIEVMANYPVSGTGAVDVSSVRSREDYQALKATLDQNAPGAFVMAGTTEDAAGNRVPFQVVETGGDEVLEAGIHLRRLVSKVTVSKITRQFSSASLGAKPLTVKGIYLTNVYTQARYASDYVLSEMGTASSLWYNALGWHRWGSAPVSEKVDALVGERGMNRSLAQGETASLDVNLYFYPNPVLPSADVPSSEWAAKARCTRLVVWAQVEGRDYYYPATLPKEDAYAPIGRNSVFTIHCTLTALGSIEEDSWVPGAMEVTFEPVLPDGGGWDGVNPINEES